MLVTYDAPGLAHPAIRWLRVCRAAQSWRGQ